MLLGPDLAHRKFEGVVRVTLDVIENCEEIVLHAADLSITAAFVDGANAASFHLNDEQETLTVVPHGGGLFAGTSVELKIDFHAPLSENMKGFYHSSYVDLEVSGVTVQHKYQACKVQNQGPCRWPPCCPLDRVHQIGPYWMAPFRSQEYDSQFPLMLTHYPLSVYVRYFESAQTSCVHIVQVSPSSRCTRQVI